MRADLETVTVDVRSLVWAGAVSLGAVVLTFWVRRAAVRWGMLDHPNPPEEINRVVTDALAELLLTSSADADENLQREVWARSRYAASAM